MDNSHKEEVASDGQDGAGSNKIKVWGGVALLAIVVAGGWAFASGAFDSKEETNIPVEGPDDLVEGDLSDWDLTEYPPVNVTPFEIFDGIPATVSNASGFETPDGGTQVTGGTLEIPLQGDYHIKMNGFAGRFEESEIVGDQDELFQFDDFSCNLPGMDALGFIGMNVSEIIMNKPRLRGLKELNLFGLFRAGFKSLDELDHELRNFVNLTNLQPIDDERLLFIRLFDNENSGEVFGKIAPEAWENKAAKSFRFLFSKKAPFQSTAVFSLKRPMVLFSVANMMGLKIPASVAITGPIPISLNLVMGLKSVYFGFSDPTDPNGIQVPFFNAYGQSLYSGIVQEQIITNSFMGGKFAIGVDVGSPIPLPQGLSLAPKVSLGFSGKIATNTDFDEILGSSSFAQTGNLTDAGKWIKGFAGEGDVSITFTIGGIPLIKKFKYRGCELFGASYQYRNDETLGDLVAISSTVNNALIQCPLDKLSGLLGLDKPDSDVNVYMHLVEKFPSTGNAQVAMAVTAVSEIFSHTVQDIAIKMETDVSDYDNQKYEVSGYLDLGIFSRRFSQTVDVDSDSISFDGYYEADRITYTAKYTTSYEIRTDGIFMGVQLEACGKILGNCVTRYQELLVTSADVQFCYNTIFGDDCIDLY